MVRSSGQQKCALIFCGVLFLVLGSGITASGFIYDFLDPYDAISTPQSADGYFSHIQYWLGIPVSFGKPIWRNKINMSSNPRSNVLACRAIVYK